jgi:hypothetical protein
MTEVLRIDYLFDDYRRFPWDVLGFSVPRVGSVHSYLCEMLAPWAPEDWRAFMAGRPSLRELQRAAGVLQGSGNPIVGIAVYTDACNSMSASERTDVAQEVLDYLYRHRGFREYVQKTLDRLWLQGLISVPREVRP